MPSVAENFEGGEPVVYCCIPPRDVKGPWTVKSLFVKAVPIETGDMNVIKEGNARLLAI